MMSPRGDSMARDYSGRETNWMKINGIAAVAKRRQIGCGIPVNADTTTARDGGASSVEAGESCQPLLREGSSWCFWSSL